MYNTKTSQCCNYINIFLLIHVTYEIKMPLNCTLMKKCKNTGLKTKNFQVGYRMDKSIIG